MFQKHQDVRKQKKGQSTVEYILLFAAIIAVLMVFLAGPFRTTVDTTVMAADTELNTVNQRLIGAHQ